MTADDYQERRRRNCVKIYNNLKNNFRNKFKNNILDGQPTIFTSYMCDINDFMIQNILRKWQELNKNVNILYFSDKDVNNFFKNTEYYELYSKMKNGVAIADFFRINYINKFGGFWFDIDLEPFPIRFPKIGNIFLFDCGFQNISYMFIGGKPNQKLFNETIEQVSENIKNNIEQKKQLVLNITGPRIIQNIIFKKIGIQNKDGNLQCNIQDKVLLQNTEYEFIYNKINIKNLKTNDYLLLQKKYNKKQYQKYNYI